MTHSSDILLLFLIEHLSKVHIRFTVSVHLLEKWRHFAVWKHYCALGLELGLELGVSEKYVFDQTCFRTSVVDPYIHT